MIAVGNTLVSEDILEKQFVCDLTACKGACCVAGESGAPLEEEELAELDAIQDAIEPYLTKEGKRAIKKQGNYIVDSDGDYVTPLIGEEQACAYTIFENGIAFCAIEKAYKEGKIKFRKPISCYLYPIRIDKGKYYDNLNYHKWSVCKAACVNGNKLSVPVYIFLKDALIKKYGKKWYALLEKTAVEFLKK